MAEFKEHSFQEVMRQLNRMCSYYPNCADSDCPLFGECGNIGSHSSNAKQVMRIEERVMAWAAKHPVVYPTWGEWLISVGAARKIPTGIPFELQDGRIVDLPWETVVDVNTPIPADIAQKLGIEPKEAR